MLPAKTNERNAKHPGKESPGEDTSIASADELAVLVRFSRSRSPKRRGSVFDSSVFAGKEF